MITNIATIIITIVTICFASIIDHFSKSWLESLRITTPKNKRSADIIRVMIKYIIFAFLTIFIYVKVEFDKSFVLSIFLLFLICSFFIAKDVYGYHVKNLIRLMKRDEIQAKIDYQFRLLSGSGRDRERYNRITEKIRELQDEKEAYS